MDRDFYIHDTSLIGSNTVVGRNTRIWQFCNIMDDVHIGCDCNIGQNVFIEKGVEIGNHVKIKNNISIYEGVICEDGVFLGPNCVFTNVINPRAFIEKKDQLKQTLIKYGATVGANATVVCGNCIGKYAMVGAGSVITHSVKDYELVVGNPARHIGYVCRCGETLMKREDHYWCSACKTSYWLENGNLICEEDKDGIY